MTLIETHRGPLDILLINQYAGSPHHGMEFRPYYLAREWVRLGHRVAIVAATASHVRTVAPAVSGIATEELIDGIRYVWLATPGYTGNGARRALNMLAFVAMVQLRARLVCGGARPSLVIASSTQPMDIWPAARIARKAGARLVYEVHDLWPLSPIELGGISPRHPFMRLLQRAEDDAYRMADRVVSMLPCARGHMEARGMAPDKFVYIPNGIDPAEWEDADGLPVEISRQIDAEAARGRFLVGYAGAHGLANALDNLVEAAWRLRDRPVAFVLIGQGPEKSVLQARARDLGLENMLFLPPVPKACVPSFLARMDALYIGLKRQPLFRFGISPNKLMDYMMAARPVIQAIEAGNDIVAEAECGISVTPEDPDALAAAIDDLRTQSAATRSGMGDRGRRYVELHHSYRLLAPRFLDAVLAPTSDAPPPEAVAPRGP